MAQQSSDHGGSEPREPDLTSVHVRRAEAGDPASLSWVIERFSPLLLAQASHRLGPRLRAACDPEDLVSQVWAIALPRLAGLLHPERRCTPILMKFLGTTLLHRVNYLVKKELAGPRATLEADGDDSVPALPAETTGVVTAAVRRERQGLVAAALAELEPQDREIIILRGIEQTANKTAAMVLGLAENTVSMRYARALERLRHRLPGSLFAELADDRDL